MTQSQSLTQPSSIDDIDINVDIPNILDTIGIDLNFAQDAWNAATIIAKIMEMVENPKLTSAQKEAKALKIVASLIDTHNLPENHALNNDALVAGIINTIALVSKGQFGINAKKALAVFQKTLASSVSCVKRCFKPQP